MSSQPTHAAAGSYRTAPALRPIHTKLSLLPDAMQRVLLSSKRDRDEAPYAISLRAGGRPGALLLGLLLLGASYVAYRINLRSGLLTSDGTLLVLGLTTIGAVLAVYGFVSTARSMALRLRPQAILFPRGWLTCTTGIRSHLDLVPLSMIERIVPAQGALEVALHGGEVRRYPMKFETSMSAFFAHARAEIASASRPDPSDPALPREIRRPSAALPFVVALVVGPMVALPSTLGAMVYDARREAELLRISADRALAEDAALAEPERSRSLARSLDFYFESVEEARRLGGLSSWLFEHVTTVEEDSARFRPLLDQARAVTGAASTEDDRVRATTSTSAQELRRIADAHAADDVGALARARLAEMVVQARAREVAAGAPPSQLALCDAVAQAARGGRGALRIEVRRSVTEDASAFSRDGWTSTESARAEAHRALADEAPAAFARRLYAAFGAGGDRLDADPVAVIEVALRPTTEVLQYTSERVRTHHVVSSYTVPVLGADVRVAVTGGPTGTFEYAGAHAALAEPMAPEHMAEAYPTTDRLYAAEGRDLGGRIGAELARHLCLP